MTICSFNLTAMTAGFNFNCGIDICLIGISAFSMTNAESAELFVAANVDTPHRVFRCVSKHMKFSFIPRCFEVSSIDACFNYSWKLLLSSQEFGFFIRLHFVVPMLLGLCSNAFQISSHVKKNGANNPIMSNTEDSRDRTFLRVIGASTSLFVLLHA